MLSKMNRLLMVLQDAKQEGIFDPSKNDEASQQDIKAEIRELLAEVIDLVATGVA